MRSSTYSTRMDYFQYKICLRKRAPAPGGSADSSGPPCSLFRTLEDRTRTPDLRPCPSGAVRCSAAYIRLEPLRADPYVSLD